MERLFRVKAHPASRENRLTRLGPDRFEVWVRAEAERGLANASVVALVARELNVEPKRLRIVKGAASPAKILALLGKEPTG